MRARLEKISPDLNRSFHVVEWRVDCLDPLWHFHPELELTVMLEGCGRRFVGDSIEPFVPGDLVLVGPNVPHFWCNEGIAHAGLSHSVVVQFRADFLGQELWARPELRAVSQLFTRSARGIHFAGPTAEAVATRLRHLPRLAGLPALLELLGILGELASVRDARPLTSEAYVPHLDHAAEARLARIYRFLMQHFREPLTLSQIAEVAAMTPVGFSRYFKRMTGRNVSVFLNELRVDHAARLLADTSLNVTEIAAEAGFPTLSNFNRRFRERLKCAPRDYRRIISNTDADPHGIVLEPPLRAASA